MDRQQREPDWLAAFPRLSALTPPERVRLIEAGRSLAIAAGTVLYRPGQPCRDFLMLAAGRVRVQLVSEQGREIVLYRVGPGETCILTTSCLMAARDYGAEAVAETDIRAVSLAGSTFQSLLADSAAFRDFVLSAYGERLVDVIELLVEVAFSRVDTRLAHRLITSESGLESDVIVATHQDLATELGTAREVVSRQLKEFERRGWVDLQRGRILLRDRAALGKLAAQASV
ncbi:MAG: helix-turn-helix domain-containing protein [Alphaproteobacteria bacterium]|nr:helix-turn-helix domain-containing protein [Alphaproteobacteria bacterium]